MLLVACGGDSGDNGDESTPDSVGAANVVEVGDTVSVEYEGRLSNGEVFDSSAERAPMTFTAGVGEMIPGFDAAVLGMELNEEKTVDIPSELAYGEQGFMDLQTGEYIIPPNEDIAFDIKVVNIQKTEAPAE